MIQTTSTNQSLQTPGTGDPQLAEAEIGVIAGWYAGCGPLDVPDLRAEHFEDPRTRAVWKAIQERGEKGTDFNLGEVQEAAKIIARLDGPAWYGLWRRITDAAERANADTMRVNARMLMVHWEKRQAAQPPAARSNPLPGVPEGWVEGPPGMARFAVWPAAEALKPLPPIKWIVDGLIRPGCVSLWYGKPGSKKTYALLWLAVCAALGKEWLDFKTVPACGLIVDEESGRVRLHQRLGEALHGALVNHELPLSCMTESRVKLNRDADAAKLLARICETKAELVIIDSLAATTTGDENSKQDAQVSMDKLRELAQETNAHIAIIHHSGKNGSNRGSSVFEAAPDLVVHITSEDGSRYVNFKTDKHRDAAPMQWSAKATWVAHPEDPSKAQFYMDWTPPRRREEGGNRLSPLRQWIFDELKENGESSLPDLTEAGIKAGVGAKFSIRDALYAMARDGQIRRTNPDERGHAVSARYILDEPDEEP